MVQGLSNCLVKFSKCCSLSPATRSWALSPVATVFLSTVRTAPTPTPPAVRRRRRPWIKVSWGGKTRESYRTNLQVVSKDRPNLLVDISTILSAAKVHVSSLTPAPPPTASL